MNASKDMAERTLISCQPVPGSEVSLAQGAEARVFSCTFSDGTPAVVKERFAKVYRHPTLDDRLTRERLGGVRYGCCWEGRRACMFHPATILTPHTPLQPPQEARALSRAARGGVAVPTFYAVDVATRRIYMEAVPGPTVKAWLCSRPPGSGADAPLLAVGAAIGAAVAGLHALSLVHGDLTTSNMVLRGGGGDSTPPSLVLIDFGLATTSSSMEDRGVDLYVLERALASSHTGVADALWGSVLAAYEAGTAAGERRAVMARLEAVRKRGRKRMMEAFG